MLIKQIKCTSYATKLTRFRLLDLLINKPTEPTSKREDPILPELVHLEYLRDQVDYACQKIRLSGICRMTGILVPLFPSSVKSVGMVEFANRNVRLPKKQTSRHNSLSPHICRTGLNECGRAVLGMSASSIQSSFSVDC